MFPHSLHSHGEGLQGKLNGQDQTDCATEFLQQTEDNISVDGGGDGGV